MDNTADFQTESVIDRTHPVGVAFGQIIINCHNMNASAPQSVQIGGQRCRQSFAFPRFHLGNLSPIKNDPSQYLCVKMAQSDGAPRGLTNRRESFWQ